MPIQVTCRNCLKRFSVSDKFAGKKGPCPNCKKTIEIPKADEEVVIHAPPDDAPKDSTGQSVLKPIERKETDVTRKGLIITIVTVVTIFGFAAALRFVGDGSAPLWTQIIGLLVFAPPLIWAGYSALYDQEREPYVGPELRNRVLICSAIFPNIWVVYAFAPAYLLDLDQASHMSWTMFGITLCAMIGLGGLASAACFDLDFMMGVLHSGMYFIGILLLAIVSGVTLAGEDARAPDDFTPSENQPVAMKVLSGDDIFEAGIFPSNFLAQQLS